MTGAGSTIAPWEAFVIRDLDKNNISDDLLTQKINKMSVIWRQIASEIIDFHQNKSSFPPLYLCDYLELGDKLDM